MKHKPKTPYQHLLETLRDYANRVEYRRRTTMFRYPKAKLNGSWRLDDVAERVSAAKQLGYTVELSVNDDGDLVMTYVKDIPKRPFEAMP